MQTIHATQYEMYGNNCCLHPLVTLGHSFKTKLFLNPEQIRWIWISKILWAASYVRLMVNVIPGDDVVEARGRRAPDGEDEPAVERFPQQPRHLLSLLAGWQEGRARGAAVPHTGIRVLGPLDPRRETVLYDDAAAVLVPGQLLPAARHRHRARRLGPGVRAVEGVADRTRGLLPENAVDALGAEGVATRERLLLPNRLQTNGAVLRTLLLRLVCWAFHFLFFRL